jgi:hypothetical protein
MALEFGNEFISHIRHTEMGPAAQGLGYTRVKCFHPSGPVGWD